tara:strand:- start:148 stop:1575 length:1428 start_codon:yes stop_codon:yes gene_type:complete
MSKKKNLNNQRSIESEKALIASVLTDNAQIERVLPIVKKDMFYNSFNGVIWSKIVDLYRSGVAVDVTTLQSQLDNGDSPTETPVSDILGFFDCMVSASNSIQYAKNIYEKSELRKLSVMVNKIQESLGTDNIKTNDTLSKIHSSIGDILSIHGDTKFNLDNTIKDAISDMNNSDNTIKFGFNSLDNMVGGMRRGEITVVAGRPGHFKSTMIVNIVNSLLKRKYKVLVINREMRNSSVIQKLMVIESVQVSYSRVITGELTKNDKLDLDVTADELSSTYGENLQMKDVGNDFESTVKLIRQVKPDVVIDDYIGLATLRHIDDPRLRTDAIMKEYKSICKSNNICAIVVSQLNRKCEERPNKRPIPSDLRESGSIEQDAETILFMFYEYRYSGSGSKNGEFGLDVIVGKNRYGKTGTVELGVLGDKCKVYDHHSIALADNYEIQELSNDESKFQKNKNNNRKPKSLLQNSKQQTIQI